MIRLFGAAACGAVAALTLTVIYAHNYALSDHEEQIDRLTDRADGMGERLDFLTRHVHTQIAYAPDDHAQRVTGWAVLP